MNTDLSIKTSNLRAMFHAFADEYPKAAEEGRLVEWEEMVMTTVRVFASKPKETK